MRSTILLLLLSNVLATPVPGGGSNCFDFLVPVTFTAPFFSFKPAPFNNGYEMTEFLLESLKRDTSSDLSLLLAGPENKTVTYDISARYCTAESEYAGH